MRLCYYPLLHGSFNSSTKLLLDVTINVWYHRDFGLCFEYLIFLAFLGAVFGVVSAFYAGIKHTKYKRKRKAVVLVVRGLISFCTLVAFLVDFMASFWLSPGRPYSVTLSIVVIVIAWILHLFYIWVLSCSVHHYGRGPINLNAVWILLFVGTILQLRTTIRWKLHPKLYQRSSLPIEEAYFSKLSCVTVYVVFGLQCLYGLTLFFKVSHVTGDNVKMYPPFHASLNRDKSQWSDDAESSVRQHLISSEWKTDHVSTTYGSLTASYDSGLTRDFDLGKLDASEDNANPLSLLSFWWVGPLMRRGAFGLLQKPEDLLQLPKSLATMKLRQRFQRIRGISDHDSDHVVIGHEATKESKSKSRSEGDTCVEPEARKLPSLFHSLNRAFGLHYYPLGILKLMSDMLGFAGPLLLHALVSFMENKTVSEHAYG